MGNFHFCLVIVLLLLEGCSIFSFHHSRIASKTNFQPFRSKLQSLTHSSSRGHNRTCKFQTPLSSVLQKRGYILRPRSAAIRPIKSTPPSSQPPQFKRQGLQIMSTVNISFHEAILGTRVLVDTVDGSEWIYLRPGTQSGHEVRLPGKGLPDPRTGFRGSHFVLVNVLLPAAPNLSPTEKTVVQQIARVETMWRRVTSGKELLRTVKSVIHKVTRRNHRNDNGRLIEGRFGLFKGLSLLGLNLTSPLTSDYVDSLYQGMDAYGILDIPRDASEAQIKRAYHRAISKWHPDKWHQSNDAQRVEAKLRSVAINFAYYCLEDAARRARYDHFGAADMESFLIAEKSVESEAKALLDELITNKTVSVNSSIAGAKGLDVKAAARLTFREAVAGVEKMIKYSYMKRCPHCNGTGLSTHSLPSRSSLPPTARLFHYLRTHFRPKECIYCSGAGCSSAQREIWLKIPPGVVDGMSIRRRGEGDWGPGAVGDLLVEVSVDADPRFERQGLQIMSTVNISFHEAILGTRVLVDTVDGSEWVYLRPGTQSGHEVRLPGKGLLSASGSGRGDMLVRVNVRTPKYPFYSISRYLVSYLSFLSKKS